MPKSIALLVLSASWTVHLVFWPIAIHNSQQVPMACVTALLAASTASAALLRSWRNWDRKAISLLAESIDHKIDWAKERSRFYECSFLLSIGSEKPEHEYEIPLLIGMIPSQWALDRLVERLFSGTAWRLKCSSIHQPATWGGRAFYTISWEAVDGFVPVFQEKECWHRENEPIS